MKSYPTVNWWRGNLRAHDSRLSLTARFARLNRISVPQCESYFGGVLSEYHMPDPVRLAEVADLLDEDLLTLRETFALPIDLPRGPEAPTRRVNPDKAVRYCEDCAALGYHSYLHEHTWLARCPFHAVPLKLAYPQTQTGTNYVRRCKTLAQIMSDACPYWPGAGQQTFEFDNCESFAWLSNWIARVSKASALFSKKRVWSSVEQIFQNIGVDTHLVGRLHALEPIPFKMRPLFDEVQDGWGADIQRFPLQARRELSEVSDLGLDSLFSIYKRIAAYAATLPGFARDTNSCIQALQSDHSVCRCEWGREKAGWTNHWVRVHPDDWPHWNLVCPYAVAREQLELATGRRLEVLTRRQREAEEMALIVRCHTLMERGLIGMTPCANASPEGRLYVEPQIWPPIEWVGTPWLNAVLNAATECEVSALYSSLCDWLDDIAQGNSPVQFTATPPLIWLSEAEDGLVLIKWHRKRKHG